MDRNLSRSKRRKIDNDLVSTSQTVDKTVDKNVDKNVDKVDTSPVLSVSDKIRHFSAIAEIGRAGVNFTNVF